MKFSRIGLSLVAVLAASVAFGQAWSDAYNAGLKSARSLKWGEAREAFVRAASLRAEDYSGSTKLPGPATERRFWRNGAPYSPNFAAAYCGLKLTNEITSDADKTALLKQVAGEFEALVAKGQDSRETYYFLSMAYSNLRDVAKQQELETKYQGKNGKFDWKVDGEFFTQEDKAALGQLTGNTDVINSNGGTTTTTIGDAGPARVMADKYALLIGNSESRVEGMKVPFAASDVLFLREKLVQYAGYGQANIDVISNAGAAQMKASAEAFAQRVTNGATVFLFFSGGGSNLDGKDFLAGIDAKSSTDSASMYSKGDLYKLFVSKGCKIFAFFQVSRPVVAGRYFGLETPMVGSIAQTQATIPNGSVYSVVRNGQEVGLFSDAIGGVLGEFRSNQVPITEFGWRVFDWMRGGRNGDSGTGSQQVMTLPVIVNMLSDERF